DRVRGVGPGVQLGRSGMDGKTPQAAGARRTGGNLRGPSGIVAARAGGLSPLVELPRAGAAVGRLQQPEGVHTCRTDAGDGAPVLWLLGLPGDRFLRAVAALRRSPGPDVPDRLPPSA